MKSIAFFILILLVFAGMPLRASDMADVVVRGRVLFQIGGTGSVDATVRAKFINSRIQDMISSKKEVPPARARQSTSNNDWLIVAGDTLLVTVTEKDAQDFGTSTEKLALSWAELLNDALAAPKEQAQVLVKLDGIEFFGVVTTERALASERAALIKSGIRSVIKERIAAPVKVEIRNRRYTITKGDQTLVTVNHEDAVNNHTTVPELAQEWAKILQAGIDRAMRERTRQYLVEALLKCFLALLTLLLCLWLLSSLQRVLHAKMEKIRQEAREKDKVEFGGLVALRILLSWMYWSLSFFLVGLFTYYAMLQFPYTRDYLDSGMVVLGDLLGGIKRVFEIQLFPLGSTSVSLKTILLIAFFITLVIWFGRRTRRFLEEKLLTRTRIDRGQAQGISTVVNYFIILIGFIIGLRFAGLDLSALTVVAGAVGIGIGFGLQNIVNNFISGLIILFERPIQVGDRIELGTIVGDVVKISARSTTILTNDNIAVIVPNSNFISSTVINWSHLGDRRVRFSVKIGVDYESDVRLVEKVLLETANEHPDILKNPAPSVRLMGFGDNGVNFELRVWSIKLSNKPGELRSGLYFSILDKFKQYNINIPFPQRELRLRSSVPIEARVIEQVVLHDKDQEPEDLYKEHPK